MTGCLDRFYIPAPILKPRDTKARSKHLLPLLKKWQFKPTIPVDRQVASHLRNLILKEKLPAYTRLPSIRAMAELWNTNYHTVHDALSRLVGEGLIVLRPVRGSFVAAPRRTLRRICLYHHSQKTPLVPLEVFYSHLSVNLNTLLSKRGIVVVPYYDHRPYEKLRTMPPELRKMASEGEIDAVIAMEIYPSHTSWLFRLEVPVASLMLDQPDRKIDVDVTKLIGRVIDLAVKSKRKTIGLIHRLITPQTKGRKVDALRREWERMGAQKGISIICPEIPVEKPGMHWEQISALLCEQLLEAPVPPDMIFVYPDSYMRGVAITLVKHRVEVPRQILVVSHRNVENIIFIPFPMTWLTVKIEDFALALLDQIDRQILGEELRPRTISVDLERTAPQGYSGRWALPDL